MAVHLDHVLVPSKNRRAAAKLLGELLNVPWAETGVGPFSPVYVDDGLTLDFDEWVEAFAPIHYCFRVDEADFDAILGRLNAAGIPFRSHVHGAVDNQVGTFDGARLVYWNQPDDHQWEMVTKSYARRPRVST